MQRQFWFGALIIFVSAIFNGSFTLPLKWARRWHWENTWLLFCFVYLLVLPCFLAAAFVPELAEVYRQVGIRQMLYPFIFGLLFGTSLVTFGISVSSIGMAIAFAVTLGLNSLTGSLIPLLVLNPGALFRRQGVLLLVSMVLLLLGLLLYGVAGRRREKEQNESTAPMAARSFGAGLALAIVSGIFGASYNLGFAFSDNIIHTSRQLGADTVTSTYPVWALILSAAFVPNLLYCLYLLRENRTWRPFTGAGWLREAALALAMSLAAVTAIVGYGVGATLVGRYGTSIGFTLFMSTSILASNALGALTGEWKLTSQRTRGVLAAGMAAVLVSVVVLNLGGAPVQ
jgi:L-rhamnose-H+ transport protein